MKIKISKVEDRINLNIRSDTDFSDLMYVCIQHQSDCPPIERCYYIDYCSLERFLPSSNFEHNAFLTRGNLIINSNSSCLINEGLLAAMQACEQAPTLSDVADRLERCFGRLDSNGRYISDPWIDEEPPDYKQDYTMTSFTLQSGYSEPTDPKCFNEMATVVYKHKTSGTEVIRNIQIITPSWIKQEVLKTKFIFLEEALIMDCFDINLIKKTLGVTS